MLNAPTVILTCHASYIKWLHRAVTSINLQHAAKKIVILDDCPDFAESSIFRDWTIIRCNFHNPNEARNAALEFVDTDWVVFWDADNVMPDGYIEELMKTQVNSIHTCGFIYPHVMTVDNHGNVLKCLSMPAWDHDTARRISMVESSSMWNVKAIKQSMGFNPAQPRCDDYALAIKLSRNGYTGVSSSAVTRITSHEGRRSQGGGMDVIWNAWGFTLLTLWSGHASKFCEKTMEWYSYAELPPLCELLWIDNSGDPEFGKWLDDCAVILTNKRNICVTVHRHLTPYVPAPGEPYLAKARHDHVAALYNTALLYVSGDAVVTIEDDMVPPKDGLRALSQSFMPYNRVGMVSGAYRSRTSPRHVCGGRDKNLWRDVPRFDDVGGIVEMGMCGGGFAMWAMWALRRALPLWCGIVNGYLMGWDGNACKAFTRGGTKILMDSNVKCLHLCEPVLQYAEQCTPSPYAYLGLGSDS